METSTPTENRDRRPRIIVLAGCTASGKGEVARLLARRIGAEILSVDSMKVYRGMDIGTNKPTLAERGDVPHHLIDVADPWEAFSAARFVERADQVVAEVTARGRPVVAVGGTVLYLKCWYEGLFDGPSADAAIRAEIRTRAQREGQDALHAELAAIDPQAAARIHRRDLRRIERALEVHRLTGRPISELQQQWSAAQVRRPEWNWTLFGLRRQREAGNRRVNERVRKMIAEGLVEEARRIWTDARGVGDQARQAVGYAELFAHFEDKLSLDDAIEQIKINSRRLAKRQRSWLKRMGGMRWIDVDAEGVAAVVEKLKVASSE
ncbi:IPP transferase [Phycisphaerae bacterium RAS1]|nr:IPP transferase [Phycisphaerae bacterium RAS1]